MWLAAAVVIRGAHGDQQGQQYTHDGQRFIHIVFLDFTSNLRN